MERELAYSIDIQSAYIQPALIEDSSGKKSPRGIQRFSWKHYALFAAMSLLVACDIKSDLKEPIVAAIPEVVEPTPVSLPLVALSINPYDYCPPITESSNVISKVLSGTPVPKEAVVRPVQTPQKNVDILKDEIDTFSVIAENIKSENPVSASKVKAMIMPIGYSPEEIKTNIPKLVRFLDWAYEDIAIEFPYLDISVPLSVDHVQQLASFTDKAKAEKLIRKINRMSPIDISVFVINTPQFLGTTYWGEEGKLSYALVSGQGASSKAATVHEIGHGLWLSDGYKDHSLAYQIPNEALFPNIESLPQYVKEAYLKQQPPIVATGGICSKYGENVPIFTFYNRDDDELNIMKAKTSSDKQIEITLKEGKKVFDPVQIAIMNQRAKELLAAR